MKRTVSLFYQSKVKYGGFVSYTYHLAKAFRNMGYDCEVYKIRNTTERKYREFCGEIESRNISIDTAAEILKSSDYAIVTATFWRGYGEWIAKLIELGAEVVLHDHTDYTNEFKDFLLSYDVHPIVIREANFQNLCKDGLQPVYIPHPYVSTNPLKVERDLYAVSVCRLDYDKRSDIIIRANELLPKSERIHIWGTHTRMYMFQKIIGKYKGWTDTKSYTGPMYPKEQQKFPLTPGYAVSINNRAEFSCDMSAIKGDGGGTQYSFLEAIDAGAVLVLNRGWFLGNGKDELVEGINCLAVSDADELAQLLHGNGRRIHIRKVKAAQEILNYHSAQRIIPKMMRALRGG